MVGLVQHKKVIKVYEEHLLAFNYELVDTEFFFVGVVRIHSEVVLGDLEVKRLQSKKIIFPL